jgi:hypothetical protein
MYQTKKIWMLSVAADATKIPGKVEFCEPYGVWVGVIYPDHIVPQAIFDPDLFVYQNWPRHLTRRSKWSVANENYLSSPSNNE